MYGHNNFAARAIGVVVNMDRFLGDEFEKGLASMKSVAEASPRNRDWKGEKTVRFMVLVESG